MQAIMETLFDTIYLIGVITIGIIMLLKGGKEKEFRLFGIMAIVLGAGDSFHLIPRAYALLTTGLEANAVPLGIGKFITSITMTIFYVILYHIWKLHYKIEDSRLLTNIIYLLSFIRIVLCFFPQNEWLNFNAPVSWGIYRNIPFALMGIIIIYIFYIEVKKHRDKDYKYMWIAIILSFVLYIPVVLWSKTIPVIGILMIPKTLAYVWIVIMGYKALKKRNYD